MPVLNILLNRCNMTRKIRNSWYLAEFSGIIVLLFTSLWLTTNLKGTSAIQILLYYIVLAESLIDLPF
jgi:hypothetical protein